jgi:hypothetical protein
MTLATCRPASSAGALSECLGRHLCIRPRTCMATFVVVITPHIPDRDQQFHTLLIFFYFRLLSFFSCFLSLLSILGMSRTCSQPERRTDVRGASLDSPTPAKVHSGYYTSSVATISSKMLPAGQPKSLPAFYDIADILTNENAAEKLMLQRGRNNFGLVVAPSAICCQDTKF